jgi:hypothetical protein
MNKIKLLYINNPIGFILFISINIILSFSGIFIKLNTIPIYFLYIIFYILITMVNRIIFQKNYLKNIIIDANNVFTISINAIKCYIKYLLYYFLFSFIILLAIFIIIFIKFNNIQDYAQYISNIENTILPILIMSVMLMLNILVFYKLIFIEHILVQKNNKLKIKDLVKISFEIIKYKKYYISGLYFINNILIMSFIIIKYIINMSTINNIILGVIQIVINCIYIMLILIFYGEYKIKNNEEII